jgi:prophage regulatory protein
MITTIDPVLRFPAVKAITGLARSTIYLKIGRNEFPKPISLGDRAVGFLQSDIEKWLQQRIALSRQAA